MKSIRFILPLALLAALMAGCGGAGGTTSITVGVAKVEIPTYKGGIPDVIQYTVQTNKELGLKDVLEGGADIFLEGVSGADYRAFVDSLSTDQLDKIEEYVTPTISWSYLFNPIPNAAPYTWTHGEGKDKVTEFNPMAIREVRFAMNWIFSRKKIIDEILKGDGFAQFTAMTPGQPGAYRFNLVPAKLGLQETGDEKRAIADIDAAMTAAANLPENKGKLEKKDGFWNYDGKPIVLKFYIRIDDPTGRLLAGRYVADQIEKAGLKVERIEVDRRKCSGVVYGGDPANLEWHVYTEGWGAGGTRKFWDVSMSQMYAPYFGYMDSGVGDWHYTNDEMDAIAMKLFNGQYMDEKEYWDGNLEAMEIGLTEAVRIFVCSMNQYVIANKDRFVGGVRMAYGLGDGVNNWSLLTANIKPTKVTVDGVTKDLRVLKVKLYSAKGSLFMNAWDPVNPQGFNDVYAQAIVSVVTDGASLITPNNADAEPWRASWKLADIRNEVELVDGNIVGKIDVPADALMYDPAAGKWVPAFTIKDAAGPKAGSGLKAWSSGTYSYYYGSWHNGQKVELADIMYSFAFSMDWSNQDFEGDENYDEEYASNLRPGIEDSNASIKLNADGTFTTYFNYNNPIDFNYVAATGVVGPGQIPWEIREACALLVTEGGTKGDTYLFAQADGAVEIDLAKKDVVEEIKAKLVQMRDGKHMPKYLAGTAWLDEGKALARYDASIKFIEKYGHALVSNGPYFIAKIEGESFVELRSIRELPNFDYPFTADYWYAHFMTKLTKVDNVVVPAAVSSSADATLEVSLSELTYPIDIAEPAKSGATVTATLVTPSGEKAFLGTYMKDGTFLVTIPKDELAKLAPGGYVVVIESKFDKEAPSVYSTVLYLNK